MTGLVDPRLHFPCSLTGVPMRTLQVTLPESNSQDWLRVSFFALVRAKRNGHVRGAVGAALAKES